jgi:D-beta-D-heptose 7-phosphate kinase/D-beta-D-heptose 1-phosphate adenosyltransferase
MAHLDFLRHKIVDREELRRRHNGWSVMPQRVAFTNGCFDLLHAGHLDTLLWCADHADVVVVGINDDDSVRRLKGEGRPILPLEERALMLAALQCVTAVVPFSADTPLEVIRALQPDLLVKGGDWDPDAIVGADLVRAAGGEVAVVPYREGRSTTGLAERLSRL